MLYEFYLQGNHNEWNELAMFTKLTNGTKEETTEIQQQLCLDTVIDKLWDFIKSHRLLFLQI